MLTSEFGVILSFFGADLAGDQPGAALVADVGPCSLDHDDEAVAETDRVKDVNGAPHEPREKAG